MENVTDVAGEVGSFARGGDDYEVTMKFDCWHAVKDIETMKKNQSKGWLITARIVDP